MINDENNVDEREIYTNNDKTARYLIKDTIKVGDTITLVGKYKGIEYVDIENNVVKKMFKSVKTDNHTT